VREYQVNLKKLLAAGILAATRCREMQPRMWRNRWSSIAPRYIFTDVGGNGLASFRPGIRAATGWDGSV
jgi:hypothetical protein